MKDVMFSGRTLLAIFLSGVLAVVLVLAAIAEQLDETLLSADWLNWQVQESKAYAAWRQSIVEGFPDDEHAVRAVYGRVMDDLEPVVRERFNAGTRGLARYLRGETERWEFALDGESFKRHAIERVKVAVHHDRSLSDVTALPEDQKAALEAGLVEIISGIEIPPNLADLMGPAERQKLAEVRANVRWFRAGLKGLLVAALVLGVLLLWAKSFAWLAAVFLATGVLLHVGTSMVEPLVAEAAARFGEQLPAAMQPHVPVVVASFLAPLTDSGIAYIGLGVVFLVLALVAMAWRRFVVAAGNAAVAAAAPDAPPPVRSKATFMRSLRWLGIGIQVLCAAGVGLWAYYQLFPDTMRSTEAKLRMAMDDRDWPAAFDVLYGGKNPKEDNFAKLELDLQQRWLEYVQDDLQAGSPGERFAALRTKHDVLAKHLVEPHATRYRDLGGALGRETERELTRGFEEAGTLAAAGDLEGAGRILARLRSLAPFHGEFESEERAVQTLGVLGAVERATDLVEARDWEGAEVELSSVRDYAELAADQYADAQLMIRFAEIEQKVEDGISLAGQRDFNGAEAVLEEAAEAARRTMEQPAFEGAFARMHPGVSFNDRVAFQPDVLVENARAQVRQRRR